MNLILEKWEEKNKIEFEKFLKTKSNEAKIDWTRNIVNTTLPVYAIKSGELDNISKDIMRGNYISFLDKKIFSSFESMMIYGKIISKLKDFQEIKKYLASYADKCECWATCDTLKLNIKNQETEMFNLAISYLKSNKTFVRRIGIIILFNFIKTSYVNECFEQIKGLKNEKEYYVNMAVAWFVCECVIKEYEKTIKFLKQNNLNKFTLEKSISKCQDSFRIDGEKKKFLKELKQELLKTS